MKCLRDDMGYTTTRSTHTKNPNTSYTPSIVVNSSSTVNGL